MVKRMVSATSTDADHQVRQSGFERTDEAPIDILLDLSITDRIADGIARLARGIAHSFFSMLSATAPAALPSDRHVLMSFSLKEESWQRSVFSLPVSLH